MTTNSLDQINAESNRIEKQDENIRITRSMGTTLEFLDVLVTNEYGQFKTSVYHKPAAEPYILPYSSEHPRHMHCNTIKGALFRAARLCFKVQDFDEEQLRLELTLLLNGYPLKFVTYHLKKFFQQHNFMLLSEPLDDTAYQLFHRKLLALPSRRQRLKNEALKEQEDKSKNSNSSTITVHYTFESSPMLQFKRELHRLWKEYYLYPGSLMNNVRLQIGTRSNKSFCQLFVKKKPPKSMLVDAKLRETTTTAVTNTTSN